MLLRTRNTDRRQSGGDSPGTQVASARRPQAADDSSLPNDQALVKDSHDRATQKPIRICHVSMCLQTGGLERLLVDFSRLHDRDSHELHFVAMSELGPPALEIRAADCPVETLRFGKVHKLNMLMRLKRLLKAWKIDLIHTHNTYAHFYGSVAGRLAGVRAVVNTQHGRGCGSGWKARAQFRIANRLSQRVVGVSDDAASLGRGEDPRSIHKISSIHNGIDLDKFRFRGPLSEPIAISVGRLSPEKDFPGLLRATALVSREVPDFRLKIVGDGRERETLQQLARELRIDDRVQFLGERSDVPELLTQAGLFVSASLTEGISLTLLEAMAIGLPVVTTSVGGNPEIVVDGKTGQLVPAADASALADAIIEMHQHRDMWPTMGELARDRVEQCFNIHNMVRQYESLYREILGSQPSA